MPYDFSFEHQLDWRHFGKRYLDSKDFIKLCESFGLHLCNESELERYEAERIMFPVARMIMPEGYARAFWQYQLSQEEKFEFDNKYLPFHELDQAIRYQIHSKIQKQDWRHPIDRYWGIDGLKKPSEEDFAPWDSYKVDVELGKSTVQQPTATHFYHYWQIYELYDTRKFREGMYKDNNLLLRFVSPNQDKKRGLPLLFEALSYFQTLYSSYHTHLIASLQSNTDGVVILDQTQQNDLLLKARSFANETINSFNSFKLDEDLLFWGLTQMIELHVNYEEAERIKLSLALRKDIWRVTELIHRGFGTSPEEIAKKAGPSGGYIGNYLELLFPNRRKKSRGEAFNLLKHLLQEHHKHAPNVSLSDDELNGLLNYVEATNLAWFEYVLVELNEDFFELHSWHATVTFLHLKSLASAPESLMRVLIQNNGDDQARRDLAKQTKPGMGTFIDLVFRNIASTILADYKNIKHWEANSSIQFSENLDYLSKAITAAHSEDEYLANNLALATLIRNFSSHLVVDDPALLRGTYVLCVRSIISSVSLIWKTAKRKNWV